MRILMIAPEPVFRIRGTPFSVRDRCRGLSDLGHTVDLLTYPFGDDFSFPGVTIHRIRSVPGIHDIRIGFSWQKIPLDFLLFCKAFMALRRTRYDIIHTHEEAGMMGALLGPLFRVPHLYDMHSSLPQQFENYDTSTATPVLALMRWAEKFILTHSRAVIAICPHLREIAVAAVPHAPVTVIENLAQLQGPLPDPQHIAAARRAFGLENRFVIGYTGTFEINQGLDMMARAFASVMDAIPDGILFFAGGTQDQVDAFRNEAAAMGIGDRIVLPGALPPERMREIMAVCDVLTSPRRIGTNTPLKLYSYLTAGVPILATNLLTHTQVLDSDIALLTEPTIQGLADGLLRLYRDPALRQSLAAAAARRENDCYSYTAYREKLRLLLESNFTPISSP
ncbi:glycosyltransferase [bacterium]|nr:glycosyltransferase [candidate division CSSED10-310 bacterium]